MKHRRLQYRTQAFRNILQCFSGDSSKLVTLGWGDIDRLREEVMLSRAVTQVSKGLGQTA